jgi:RHH-type proline utilization regulon transcriptional repressor/proline dehydrogenase/delta 1-pyrroline-5-carboxylate dehydrogenase
MDQAIPRQAATRSERECVETLLRETRLSPDEDQRIETLATRLIETLRARRTTSPVEALMREYALSSAEGIALMCLAEALLRTPDAATRDALIRDRIGSGDWRAHLGRSPSLFVNAASWGLLVTGTLQSTNSETGLARALGSIIARGGQPVIRRALDLAMRLMGEHFVLGETIEGALNRARRLEARGFRTSYDMLGEGAVTAEDAARYRDDYRRAIDAIGKSANGSTPIDRPGISVKLSALHPRYVRNQRDRIRAELGPILADLARCAADHRIGLNIDAEESERLDLSLDLFETLCEDHGVGDGLGFVVQAYNRRSTVTIEHLIDLARRTGRRLMVRLVKGAYWDSEIKRAQESGLPEFPVFTRKAHTDLAYIACARRMLAAPDAIYPQFATHNARTLATIHELGGTADYEFQCLHGMGEALYNEVVGNEKLGRACRIYAPVGTHETLLPYLVRRLLENGANTSFVNQIADTAIPVARLAADPSLLVRSNDPPGSPHPAIRQPRDLFAPSRRNARGIDLTDEPVRAGIARILHALPNQAPLPDIDLEQAAAAAGSAPSATSDQLRHAADLLEANMETMLPLLAREAGKTAPNAIAEVREAVDFLRYYASEPTHPDDRPLGIVACISPWNFPLAIFVGQIAAALAAGNRVLAKPAEETPLIAAAAVALLHEAGVPRDTLALVPGDGARGAALVAHPSIDGVMFTGSTDTARAIARVLAARTPAHGSPIPFVAETGGQNAMIVDSSALPEQVVADALASAFDSAGQRCSALRILCLQDDIAPRVVASLKGAMDELAIGDPSDLSTDIGPMITEAAAAMIDTHLSRMRAAGLPVHRGGRQTGTDPRLVRPALVEIDRIDRLEGEIFGPVLHVLRWRRQDLDRVLADIEATGYGLTFGIHTRLDETITRATQRISAGNIYINRNMVGAVVGQQPFGGNGLSGTGPKAGGPLALRRLRRRNGPLPAALASLPVRIELPGPVGETNLYTLEPRGTVLCVASTHTEARAQVELVRRTGNQAVARPDFPCPSEHLAFVRPFTGTCDAILTEHELDFPVPDQGPLVSAQMPPYAAEFLVRERVVTTNNAAAGGNASLMAIG